MKLFQLEYFQAVCLHNSVTKAAQMLHVSQSSISFAIRDLEDEFGVSLFSRVKQRLILTSEGEYFLKNINKILGQTYALEQNMLDLGQTQKHLRIAVPPISGTFAFIPLYMAYVEQYPSSNIQIIESGSRNNMLGVVDERYDIILANTVHIENNQVNYLPLQEVDIVLCVSPHHPLAQEKVITAELLKDLPLVMFRSGSKHNTYIDKIFEDAGIRPNIILYSSQIHTIQTLVEGGKVGAFVFDGVAKLFPDLVMIPVKDLPRQTVFMVWKKEKHINNKARYLFGEIQKFTTFAQEFIKRS